MANCGDCGNWTVKGANFCFRCGHALAATNGSFEYSNDAPGGAAPVANFRPSIGNWKDKASTAAMLAMATAAGSLFAGWEASYIAIVPLGYLLWEPSSKLILDILGKLPEKKELPSEVVNTLRLEYKSEDNRHWLLGDFPQGIELSHIQHIAKICLSKPVGEGGSFSRRKCTRPGTLSQGQFELLRDFLLETNFAFYKNSSAPNLGILLTERCTRLLKKSLN